MNKTKAQLERAARARKGWETRRNNREAPRYSVPPAGTVDFEHDPEDGWRVLNRTRNAAPEESVLTFEERQRKELAETIRRIGDVNDATRTLNAELMNERRRGELMGAQKAILDETERTQNSLLCDFVGLVALKEAIKGHDHMPLTISAGTARAITNLLMRHGFTAQGLDRPMQANESSR